MAENGTEVEAEERTRTEEGKTGRKGGEETVKHGTLNSMTLVDA